MAAKRFEYEASLAADGTALAEGGSPLEPGDAWLPEHLVLVGLARCTLTSLAYYAGEATVSGTAQAAGVVTRRDEDGLYAFVELEVLFDVQVDPSPSREQLPGLLHQAERGCFVGNSLTPRPRYVWRVNGAHAEAAG